MLRCERKKFQQIFSQKIGGEKWWWIPQLKSKTSPEKKHTHPSGISSPKKTKHHNHCSDRIIPTSTWFLGLDFLTTKFQAIQKHLRNPETPKKGSARKIWDSGPLAKSYDHPRHRELKPWASCTCRVWTVRRRVGFGAWLGRGLFRIFEDFQWLVGGFNPFEKYAPQIGSCPQVELKIKSIWDHLDAWKQFQTYCPKWWWKMLMNPTAKSNKNSP